jgi:hypothetical protein
VVASELEMVFAWLRRWMSGRRKNAPVSRRGKRGRSRKFQPLLESLEDRSLPSVLGPLPPWVPPTFADNATIYTVTSTFGFSEGSLAYAIQSNNDAGGGGIIKFAIGHTGSSQTIYPPLASQSGDLPAITAPVFIDGWSQGGPGYQGRPLIALNGVPPGEETLPSSVGLFIDSPNVIVRGLDFGDFAPRIYHYYVTAAGIEVGSAASNVWIYGNAIGTDLTGETAAPIQGPGILVDAGATNVCIGTNGDGVNDAAERNVISGNFGPGIDLEGSGNLVLGNIIGLAADGQTAMGNLQAGIAINGSKNTIGAIAAGSGSASGVLGNTIAFNGSQGSQTRGQTAHAGSHGALTGVHVFSGTGNAIEGNSIFNNPGLGIALGPDDTVMTTEPDDTDSGANNLQFFPELSQAVVAPALQGQSPQQPLVVSYQVPSDPDSNYPLQIDFYLSDGSGLQGQTYLGSDTYTAASDGQLQAVTLTPPVNIGEGESIVATATDAAGNTSEFSPPVTVHFAPLVVLPQQTYIGLSTTTLATGQLVNAGNLPVTVSANFGDGQPPVALTPDSQGNFTLVHQYAAEGDYVVHVSAALDGQPVAGCDLTAHVYRANPQSPTSGTTVNGTVTVSIPGAITATLTQGTPGQSPGTLIVAVLPNAVTQDLPSAVLVAQSGSTLQILDTYDVRVLNGHPDDVVTVKFEVDSPTGFPPLPQYLDVQTNSLALVHGSKIHLPGLSIRRLPGTTHYEVTEVYDSTSTPNVQELFGTVFSFSGPRTDAPAGPDPRALIAQAEGQAQVASTGPGLVLPPVPTTEFVGGLQSQNAVASASSANASGLEAGPGQSAGQIVAEAMQWSDDIHMAAWSVPGGPAIPTADVRETLPGLASTDAPVTTPLPEQPAARESDWNDAVDSVFADLPTDGSADPTSDLRTDALATLAASGTMAVSEALDDASLRSLTGAEKPGPFEHHEKTDGVMLPVALLGMAAQGKEKATRSAGKKRGRRKPKSKCTA